MKYSNWKKTNIIGESIFDSPRPEGLDPTVWQNEDSQWKLRDEAKFRIIKTAKWLRDIVGMAFSDIHLIGSICSNCWQDGCDMDVHFICPGLDPSEEAVVNKRVKDMFETKYMQAEGQDSSVCGHPLEIYVQATPWKSLASAGCWDVLDEKWLTGPKIEPEDFDPYAKYWDMDMAGQAGGMLPEIRSALLSALEKAHAVLNTKNEAFAGKMSNELTAQLQAIAGLFERFKLTRRLADGLSNAEQAAALRTSDEWATADSAFKLIARFGYVGAMKECKNILKLGITGRRLAIIVARRIFSNIMKMKPTGEVTLNEDWRKAVAGMTLAGAALFGGINQGVQAKVVEFPRMQQCTPKQKINRQKYFDDLFSNVTAEEKTKKFGKLTFMQATLITACTLFGEGRDQIKKGGFDLICDSIVNRCNGIDQLPGVCTASSLVKDRKTGKTKIFHQYSFWNKNTGTIDKIKAGHEIVPDEVISSKLDFNAWKKCSERALEIIRQQYKPTSKVNSYYRTDMKDPPSWASLLTDKQVVGDHTFGYLKTNDPKFVDMTTRHAIEKKVPDRKLMSYTIKKGDTLSKIAHDNDTTVKKILADNRQIVNPKNLKIGMKIAI